MRSLFTATVWIGLVGCEPGLPSGGLDRIAPDWGYNGEETPIVIEGINLLPVVIADADGARGGRVDAQFQAWLVGDGERLQITGLDLVDYETLTGRVPAGYPTGVFDLSVKTPAGESLELSDAFTVQDTRADHLEVDVDTVVHTVNDNAVLSIVLTDPDGEAVPDAVKVRLTVASQVDEPQLVFQEGGLEAQTTLAGGLGVEGRLSSAGAGFVLFTSTVPDELEVTVEVLEEDLNIREDSVTVLFMAGDARDVLIQLPADPFVATAGEPFDVELSLQDAFGNPVEDRPTTTWILEECGDYREKVTFLGSHVHSVELLHATDADCPMNRLTAVGEASGASLPFPVRSGSIDRLSVNALQTSVVAGEMLGVLVSGEDQHGNPVGLAGTDLVFREGIGTLDSWTCIESSSPGVVYCELVLVRATGSVTFQAESQTGAMGVSDSVEVLAGAPDIVEVNVPVTPVVAGEGYVVEVEVQDTYGNSVALDLGNGDPLEVTDHSGVIGCAWLPESSSGPQSLECVSTVASQGVVLDVDVGAMGIAGQSNVIEVVNGVLGEVVVVLSHAEVTAGDPLDVALQGSDAFGNPYIVQQDSTVLVVDDRGGMVETPVILGPDGTGGALGVLPTVAGDPVSIQVSQGGQLLGEAPLVVLAAELDSLEVLPETTWAWVGEPLVVSIRAQDAYGNTVTDFGGEVSLAAEDAGLPNTAIGQAHAGEASTSLELPLSVIGVRLQASSDSGETGVSDALDVLARDCPDGPQAGLLIEGQQDFVGCLVNGSITVTADFSQSTVGTGRSVGAYHVYTERSSQRTVANQATLKRSGEGAGVVLLVVADDQACGSEAEATIWLAEQDDGPAGPITVSAADVSLTGGSATNGQTSITVEAQDCEMDVAAGQALYARVGLGELLQLSPTGEGLSVVLDGSGAGAFLLDATSSLYGGVATVEVGTLDGASYGAVEVEIQGDSVLPEVVSVDPMGQTSELFTEIGVAFSEPMRASSLTSVTVSLTGPAGAVALQEPVLDGAGQWLTVQTSGTEDASLGAYVLTLDASVSDQGGNNQLAGEYSGVAAAHETQFGALGDEGLSVTSCVQNTSTLVVDGDDGSLSGLPGEGDSVEVQVTATGTPAWWLMEVRDGIGERVRSQRTVGSSGATGVLYWDGRGDDGIVVGHGEYGVAVSTIDAHDNLSAPCEIGVSLLQRYSQPELP
ncbi:MAG: Ig-like domain-containing protein [Myxococcota bacterium]|nr:Ig-like domain-containing protein [Myxococcota bacterium]